MTHQPDRNDIEAALERSLRDVADGNFEVLGDDTTKSRIIRFRQRETSMKAK